MKRHHSVFRAANDLDMLANDRVDFAHKEDPLIRASIAIIAPTLADVGSLLSANHDDEIRRYAGTGPLTGVIK